MKIKSTMAIRECSRYRNGVLAAAAFAKKVSNDHLSDLFSISPLSLSGTSIGASILLLGEKDLSGAGSHTEKKSRGSK